MMKIIVYCMLLIQLVGAQGIPQWTTMPKYEQFCALNGDLWVQELKIDEKTVLENRELAKDSCLKISQKGQNIVLQSRAVVPGQKSSELWKLQMYHFLEQRCVDQDLIQFDVFIDSLQNFAKRHFAGSLLTDFNFQLEELHKREQAPILSSSAFWTLVDFVQNQRKQDSLAFRFEWQSFVQSDAMGTQCSSKTPELTPIRWDWLGLGLNRVLRWNTDTPVHYQWKIPGYPVRKSISASTQESANVRMGVHLGEWVSLGAQDTLGRQVWSFVAIPGGAQETKELKWESEIISNQGSCSANEYLSYLQDPSQKFNLQDNCLSVRAYFPDQSQITWKDWSWTYTVYTSTGKFLQKRKGTFSCANFSCLDQSGAGVEFRWDQRNQYGIPVGVGSFILIVNLKSPEGKNFGRLFRVGVQAGS